VFWASYGAYTAEMPLQFCSTYSQKPLDFTSLREKKKKINIQTFISCAPFMRSHAEIKKHFRKIFTSILRRLPN